MKKAKPHAKRSRPNTYIEHSPQSVSSVEKTLSTPEILHKSIYKQAYREDLLKASLSPRDVNFASECNISISDNSKIGEVTRLDTHSAKGDEDRYLSEFHSEKMNTDSRCIKTLLQPKSPDINKQTIKECNKHEKKWKNWDQTIGQEKPRGCSTLPMETDDPLMRLLQDIHHDTRKSAKIIRDSKARLLNLQKKTVLNEADIKELGQRNELLLREMERFDRLTRSIQKLVGAEVEQLVTKDHVPRFKESTHGLLDASLPDFKMGHPESLLAAGRSVNTSGPLSGTITRSKSVRPQCATLGPL